MLNNTPDHADEQFTVPVTLEQDIPLTKMCSKCEQELPLTAEYFHRLKENILIEHATFGCECQGKTCTGCNKVHCKGFYNKQKGGKEGLSSKCKQCNREENAVWREKNAEYNRERMRKYHNDHKEEEHLKFKQWREKNYTYDQERHKRYRKDNEEKVKLREKTYRHKNRDKIREREHTYWETRKERQREKARRGYWRRRESILTYTRNYRQSHLKEVRSRDRIRHKNETPQKRGHRIEYLKRWRKTHRDEIKQYDRSERGILLHRLNSAKRRAHKRSAPGTLTHEQIQQKLKAQKYRCYYASCNHAKFEKKNGKYIYHLEHTIPLSRTEHNPRHDVNYVVLACPACNQRKHNKLPHEFFEGGRLF